MIYGEQEIAEGLKKLGRYPEGKYLAQVLISELQMLEARVSDHGALAALQGRRSLAATLLTALELRVADLTRPDQPDPGELVPGGSAPRRINVERQSRRRVPERPE